jgi:hypothetical protein
MEFCGGLIQAANQAGRLPVIGKPPHEPLGLSDFEMLNHHASPNLNGARAIR